jgi:hypothetical protein
MENDNNRKNLFRLLLLFRLGFGFSKSGEYYRIMVVLCIFIDLKRFSILFIYFSIRAELYFRYFGYNASVLDCFRNKILQKQISNIFLAGINSFSANNK